MKQIEEYEKSKEQRLNRMRSLMDYVMGVIIICIGLFFLLLRNNNAISLNNYLRKPDALDIVLGSMCVLYGLWRIYRGYKKKSFI